MTTIILNLHYVKFKQKFEQPTFEVEWAHAASSRHKAEVEEAMALWCVEKKWKPENLKEKKLTVSKILN